MYVRMKCRQPTNGGTHKEVYKETLYKYKQENTLCSCTYTIPSCCTKILKSKMCRNTLKRGTHMHVNMHIRPQAFDFFLKNND